MSIGFYAVDGRFLCELTTGDAPGLIELPEGSGTVEFACSQGGLQRGTYDLVASICRVREGQRTSLAERRLALTRIEADGAASGGQFLLPHTWNLSRD